MWQCVQYGLNSIIWLTWLAGGGGGEERQREGGGSLLFDNLTFTTLAL